MAVINQEQLRRRQEEKEKQSAAAKAAQPDQAVQTSAKTTGPSAPKIEKTDKGVKVSTGPTNRPMTQEQSLLLNQRKAVRDTRYSITSTGTIGELPETLEPHREMLQKKNDRGEMMASSLHKWVTNDIDVDLGSIKDERQLFYFGTTLEDDTQKSALYKAYAKKHGLKLDELYYRAETALGKDAFDRPQSTMGRLGYRLRDANGNAINVNTASPEMIEQGIHGTANDDLRKAQTNAFYALCRTKGSRFYGYVPSSDLNTFRDNASMTQTTYNSEAKSFRTLFRQGDGQEEYNAASYFAKLDYIEANLNYDALTRAILKDELNDAYYDVTGRAAPQERPDRQDPKPKEETKEEKTGWVDEVKSAVKSTLDSLVDAVTSPTMQPMNNADAQEEEPESGGEPENEDGEAPEEAPAAPVYASSSDAGAETQVPMEQAQTGLDATMAAQEAVMQEQAAQGEMKGPAYRPQTDQADSTQETETVTLNTMSDAFGLMMQGRGDQLPEYARNYLDALYKSSGVQTLWGALDEQEKNVLDTGNEPAEYIEQKNLWKLGTTISTAMQDIASEDFPDELRSEAMMILTDVVYSADQAVRMGLVVPKEGVNLYEEYLNAYPDERTSITEGIYGGWKTLLEDKADLDAQRQKDSAKFAEDAREAVASGVYSDAQYAAVLQSSDAKDADIYQAMYENPMIGEFEYINSPYFDDGGGFDQSVIKAKLNADGVKDDMDYRFALRDSMNALYYEDAKMAVTLGMSVEEYYARMGGMTVDQLASRANRRMQAQADEITQEEKDALSAPYGEGVGAVAATAEAVKRGTNALLAMFADTLYVGKNAMTLERTASKMRGTYQTEWGVFGRDMYRRDMEALLESGDLDERYAKALREALDTAVDVYDIGIDPRDMGGLISFAGDRREAVAQSDTLMRTKGTKGENAWYRLFSTTVTNTGMLGASTMVGAVAGPVAGFAVGYGLPNYSERVYERLGEGYSLKSANALAAYDTAGMVAANVATFGKVYGELSGADALQRMGYLTAKQKNASGLARFASAVRTFFGTFLENEIDEAVKDPIKEGLTQRWIDSAIAPMYQKTDAGEDVSASDVVISIASAMTPAALARNAKETLVDTAQGAPEEAVYSVIFSLAGAGGETFHSVRMAQDVLDGKSADIGGVMEAVTEDAKDPAFREHIDGAAKQKRIDEKTVEALAAGVGEEDRQTAAKQRAREEEYRQKEAAAEQASAEAKQRYQDVRERVMNGEIEADVELENALDQWGKAETARQEAQTAAETAGKKADEAEARVLAACREDAIRRAMREKESARARAKSDVQTRAEMMQREAEELRAQADELNEQMATAYERGASMDEIEALGTQAGELLARADEIDERAEAMQAGKDTDAAQAAMDAAQERVDAAEEADVARMQQEEALDKDKEELGSIRQALRSVRGSKAKRIYLNEKQKAEVLAKTGLRTITQVNSRYGTKFRVDRKKADTVLDGGFYMDVAGQSGGLLDVSSAHPETDLLDLMDRQDALDRAMGMQASVSEDGRKAESYLGETVSRGTLDPVTQKLASHLKRKTGLELIVMPLARNIRGLYDRSGGRLILSNRLGTGEVMRQVVMHELTHYIEGTRGYSAYEDAALDAAYRGNEDALERDAQELRQRYTEAGVEISPDDVHKELVAAATEKLLGAVGTWGKSGSETIIYDLLGVKQSFPVRLYNKLTQFLAGRRAKKGGSDAVENYRALVTARDNLKSAIREAGMWSEGKGGQDTTVELDSAGRSRMEIETDSEQTRMQYAIKRDEYGQPVVAIEKDILSGVPKNEWVKTVKQVLKEKFPNGVTVGNNQIQITKKSRKEITNAKDAIWLKNNQPDVYADKLRSANHADEILKASTDYVSEGLMHERRDDIVDFGRGKVKIDVGGRMYSADVIVGTKEDGSMLLYDFVGMTKEETQRTGEHRSVPHSRRAASLTDTSVQQTETDVNAYSMQDGAQYDIAPRQFGNETVQRADAISDQVKQLLEGSTYETITNDAMVRQANERIDQNGLDSVTLELAGKEHWTPEDTAGALVALVRASSEDMLTTAAMIGMELDRRGTEMGQSIQLYSVIKKLTPAGAIMEATKKANVANRKKGIPDGSIPVGNQAPVKRTGNSTGNDTGNGTGTGRGKSEKTKLTEDEITAPETRSEGLPDVNKDVSVAGLSNIENVRMGDTQAVQGTFIESKFPENLEKAYAKADGLMTELSKLPQDVSWDNPWRLPLNPAQTALIKRYGLTGTKLPGDNYSVASTKQRMLCAIIATPNNVRGDGLLTLCQQLEAMRAGYAVVTDADLNYINGQMSTFLYAEGPALEGLPVTAEGKMALSRVFDAQANTVQAGKLEKFNSFGYTNMLSSTKTWVKNVASNTMIRPLELASEKVGGVIEQALVTPRTGNRTTDAPNKAERKAGREVFTREIGQTMVDYFVTHTDTGHGSGFDLKKKGRTFDNGMLNAYKNLVDFAMQIGDRPYWEQCYAEELAVVKRLGMKIADEKTVDGRQVKGMRDMTLEEMKTEAAVRATERVFQEDRKIINGINNLRQNNPALDLVITSIMPFVKTPTNVGMRMMQYSPIGLAGAVLKYGLIDGKTNSGKNFNQRRFVMNLGRGVTGTGMAAFGWLLAGAGLLKPGYEDEEDKDRRTIRKGMGESFSTYLKLGDMDIPLDFAQPASGPLYVGAKIAWALDEMEEVSALDLFNTVMIESAMETGNQLFDNSFLSGFSSLFRGYNDVKGIAKNIAENVAQNQMSRMTPSMIRAIAKWSDPYVRDTDSQNAIHQIINEQIVQNYPMLRQTLPVKTDVTGDRTMQSGYFSWGKAREDAALHMLNSFALPMNAIGQKNDYTLDALLELSYRTGEASFLPDELIAGNKYELKVNQTMAETIFGKKEAVTLELTDEEKREANRAYGDLLFNGDGGRAYRDAKGNYVPVTGLRTIMQSAEWNIMDDDARMKRVSDEASKAKELIIVQTAKQKKEAGEL